MAGTLEAVAVPPGSAAEAPPRVRFDCVEGLRALAALGVFFTHVAETRYVYGYRLAGFDGYMNAFFAELTVGVPIFFAISGFVLFRPFVAAHAAGQRAASATSYAARRVLRIYPAYWVALVGTVIVFSHQVVLEGFNRWVANLALVQLYFPSTQGHGNVFMGMLQAWTLCVEVTFYATLPLFAYLVRRAARRDVMRAYWIAVGGVMAAGLAARVWATVGAPPQWIQVLPSNLPYFAIGLGVALVSVTVARGGAAPRAIAWCGRHPGVCLGVAALAYLADTLVTDATGPAVVGFAVVPSSAAFTKFALQWFVAAGLLLPAVLGLQQGGRVRRVLGSRVAVFLGSISYAIYLWHWAIIRWLADTWFGPRSGQTMVKVTAIGLPLTIAVAYLSLRLVERPAIRLGKRAR